jgi:hypothetical protein
MKTKYIITYTSPFINGLVTLTWTSLKTKKVLYTNYIDVIEHCTKFRLKLIAELYCKLIQWTSDRNYELTTFKVIEYEKSNHN